MSSSLNLLVGYRASQAVVHLGDRPIISHIAGKDNHRDGAQPVVRRSNDDAAPRMDLPDHPGTL